MAQSENERRAWLTLLLAPGCGPGRQRKLLAAHGSAAAALAAGNAAWRQAGITEDTSAALAAPDRSALAHGLDWLTQPAHHLIACNDADYPPLLARTAQAPAALFVAGDPSYLWSPQLAIVGSRNASAAGLANAKSFARALAQTGVVVTSGMADGIDGAAHAAALDAGGATIAVAGTGLDIVYPRKHRQLAARIAAQGALVSEFAPGTEGKAENFPRRNRIISGLSLGTLVVEASLHSGSLITARLASEQGREVFAIPGSIHNPMARGCHRLIRDGAKLIETAEEILAELGPLAATLGDSLRGRLAAADGAAAASKAPELAWPAGDPDYARLLSALGHDPAGIDLIVARSGLTAEAVSSMLLLLELNGIVVAGGGGSYTRTTR